jgi:apolipoprotein N-acyltransferase
MTYGLSDRIPGPARTLISALSGLAVGFCFWPFKTGFVAFFVLVPFLAYSGLRDGRGRYLLNGFVFGFCYFMGSLYWIAMLDKEQITVPWLRLPAALLLSLYLALFMLLAGFLIRRLRRLGIPYAIAIAVVWGGVEYLRSLGPLGFPWSSLGYSQTPYLGIVQLAAVAGTYGLSAWLALINGLLASFLLSKRRSSLLAALLVFALPAAAGHFILTGASPVPGRVRLTLIQPNIEGSVKWDKAFRDSTIKLLTEMTVAAPAAEMVVWPETAVPFFVRHNPGELIGLKVLAINRRSHLLIGFPDYAKGEDGDRFYNSAMLLTPEGEEAGEYRKIHLVPFGEMFPFEDRFEILKKINFGEGDFSPGTDYTVFEVSSLKFGVAICFESIYPGLVREFVDRGANAIVNITNDAWFGPSLGPCQHAQMAVMRAVEFRIGVARCANTGITMFIDPYGRIISRTELFTREILTGDVRTGAGRTFYFRAGRVIEAGMLLASLGLACLSFVVPLRRSSGPPSKGLTPLRGRWYSGGGLGK